MKFKKISAIVMAVIVPALISVYAVPSSVYSNSTAYEANFSDDKSYECPMHPEITSGNPGTCSICGMDLVKKEDSKNMNCIDKEKCKQMGCDMDKCKGEPGGGKNDCMEKCKGMKDHKDIKMDDSKCKSKCNHK